MSTAVRRSRAPRRPSPSAVPAVSGRRFLGFRERLFADIHRHASLCAPEAPKPPPRYGEAHRRPHKGPGGAAVSLFAYLGLCAVVTGSG